MHCYKHLYTFNMKLHSLVLGIAILIFSLQTNASTNAAVSDSTKTTGSKIYYGGNIGLSLGSYTKIGIYPLIGYKLTPKLSSGLKIAYEYISNTLYSTKYTSYNYGGSLLLRYRIVPKLYAHIEYETINFELYNLTGSTGREWVPFFYVGGGYSQPMGNNVWLNAQVLFDVLQDGNSPYSEWSPFFSVGIGVGF